jgi:uncharacterized protein YdaU (DUF1376 family)
MSRPWFPFYVRDYRGDTSRLSTLEHGAYLLLMLEYWDKGGLPDDDEELACIVGLDADAWARARPRLRRFFREGWHHKRIDEELQKAETAYERRAYAGRKSGESRRNNARSLHEHCSNNVQQPQPQPQPHASHGHSKEESRVVDRGNGPALALNGQADDWDIEDGL